ncbi:hypothetical protein ZWY2020_047631 [Hordeum vulgare]|nr:hypothetical protein ZWY2020_047631 [Hordeum vulgare]
MAQLVAQQFENTRILRRLAPCSRSRVGALTLLAFIEPLVIFLILVVNAAVGVWQETNAEKALEALRQIQSDHATVLRDAEWAPALPVRDLVPGDVVMVRVGDKVPADMRVLRLVSSTLRVEQGSLTGETNSVNKTAHAVPADDADIQAKDCMVFAGTTVVNGSAVCLVVHTGMAIEIGKIHSQIHEALQEDDDTPLKKKLNEFGEALTKIIGLICILVWLIKVKILAPNDSPASSCTASPLSRLSLHPSLLGGKMASANGKAKGGGVMVDQLKAVEYELQRRMDPSVYDMMKTMLADKVAAAVRSSTSAKKVKAELLPSPLGGKKRSLDKANGVAGPESSVLWKNPPAAADVCSVPPTGDLGSP